MKIQKFKPAFDKSFPIIWIPTLLLLAVGTVLAALEPIALFVIIPTDLFTIYFLVSPLFGYVELRESSVFVKFGLFAKREIPYSKIRGITKERKLYADSMMSLKNALEHVNIKHNTFDVTSVSVKDNDEFISAIEERIKQLKMESAEN